MYKIMSIIVIFRFSRWFQKFLLLVISPFTLLFAASLISCLDTKYESLLGLLITSWETFSHGLLLTCVDKYFFGSWMFTLFSLAIFPNWLTLWGISFCDAV